ncbi:elongation factor P 5-aminopentanone reductase [Sulfoacidibacillus ferrooxidans]|uniref:3-oxoacyl-[acyl-carrier-protein] reductase FabG n=1 Tax=Sulfoacidibacillus ferrooxidans TaxID=2005001 RepID=A0A9X1V955_9BACL|nr:glucose 1-dehydrogenase [Sulfoacidibacillus ferrooxidans]MCI0181792.1 3-oxoacyl-[acyl-carrier-protein] reductase FabG [Sulfoacidibacillus ferrooxidans]
MSLDQSFSTTRPLFGQVALVTGASRGIGAEIARTLAKAGAAVAINYLVQRDAALEVAAQCQSYGSKAIAIQANVTNQQAINQLVTDTNVLLGTPSILVNNAGLAHAELFLDTKEKTFDELMNANVKAPFFCAQAVLPAMIRAQYGRIVNIGSIWGISGGSLEVAYSASKGGLLALTKALAKEVAPSGVTVNAVAPGAIETDMLSHLTEEDLDQLTRETPVGRLGTPIDVATAVLFLVSPNASFITGQVISPNGGLVI